MSKTWEGHYIKTIDGEDYVLHKDYMKLDDEIERQSKMLINRDKELLKTNDEIERLNNIIEKIRVLLCEFDGEVMKRNYVRANGRARDIRNIIKKER